jgi:protein TIF31
VDVNFKETDLEGDLYHSPHQKSEELPTYDSGDVRYPHRFVLLRPELLDAYKDTELRSWIYSQVAESNARKDAEAKARLEAMVRRDNETDEQATRRAGIEALVESLHQPQTIININDFDFAYNPDAFVDRKDPSGGREVNEDDPSTKSVREASNYLRKSVISSFLGDCVNNGTVPADGYALSKMLHARGLNIRYLGLIASQATVDRLEVPEKHMEFARQALKVLLEAFEREMVVRGTKHVLRKLLAGRDFQEMAPIVSHFLNCLVGTSFNSRPAPDTSSLTPTTRERPWTKLTPESLQQSILLEIARRYRYNLNPSYFTRLQRPQILREVCLRSGIQLQARDFLFEAAEATDSDIQQQQAKRNKKSLKTPLRERLTTFEPEDIAHIYPITKEILHKVSSLCKERKPFLTLGCRVLWQTIFLSKAHSKSAKATLRLGKAWSATPSTTTNKYLALCTLN